MRTAKHRPPSGNHPTIGGSVDRRPRLGAAIGKCYHELFMSGFTPLTRSAFCVDRFLSKPLLRSWHMPEHARPGTHPRGCAIDGRVDIILWRRGLQRGDPNYTSQVPKIARQ